MTDLDPLLREAMTSVPGPVNITPSLTDIHRRARRHNRRRVAIGVGALACTGVATGVLIIKRDSAGSATGSAVNTLGPLSTNDLVVRVGPTATAPATTAGYGPSAGGQIIVTSELLGEAVFASYNPATSSVLSDEQLRLVVEYVRSLAGPGTAAAVTTTSGGNQSPVTTADSATFSVTDPLLGPFLGSSLWFILANYLGVSLDELQASNPGVNFANPPHQGESLTVPSTATAALPPPTTASSAERAPGYILLIDGGAPAAAMDDALARLSGFSVQLGAPSSKRFEQSVLMPVSDHDGFAQAAGSAVNIDGFDMWDPALMSGPAEGIAAAIVIGADYWQRVSPAATQVPRATIVPTTTTTTTA